MKKFMIAVMLVVGVGCFAQTSEARGPVRNAVAAWRAARQTQSCCETTVVATPAPSCCGSSQPAVSNNVVWSTPSDGHSFPTPIRNAVYNVMGCPVGVCPR